MDNNQHEGPKDQSASKITERAFIDPEKLTDTEYAAAQLDMWGSPAAINLTPLVISETCIGDNSESFRTEQMNLWKSRLIKLMERDEELARSLGENNPYRLLFNEAYARSSTVEQRQALSAIERLALVASGPIVTKRNMYSSDQIVRLIRRVLDS
ncbi:MAG TPA: hypothetical protein PKC86_02645 [Candidatus Saccharibacteria bacterium]|nr:hypothetical protein [Candidatus Saccharibacteria bacterium]HRN97552.1 hypothetical protein [Candidatus Saccharibacteria bacterium]HRQ06791.1 hypothetical protein [Candidatus Saccharibacteria bacterium]